MPSRINPGIFLRVTQARTLEGIFERFPRVRTAEIWGKNSVQISRGIPGIVPTKFFRVFSVNII